MRKALVALVALAVLVPVGTYAYIHWIKEDAPERLSLADDAPPTSAGTTAGTGTTVIAVDLTVDMASMSSDESRRDGQFRGGELELLVVFERP